MSLGNYRLPPCYVLSLDSPGGTRYESASEQFAKLGITPQFVKGIQFKEGETSPLYSPWRNLLFMKRRMTTGEISVYLGHRKVWEQILHDGHETALVMEDDFFIHDHEQFVRAVDDAMAVSEHWDIVKFFDFRPKPAFQKWKVNCTEFVLHNYASSGCVAYLVNAAKAQALLKQPFIYRPIDEDWSHPWENHLRIVSVTPNPISEIAPALGGSLLDVERRRMKAACRNTVRSVYGNLLALNKATRALGWKRKMAKSIMPEFRADDRKVA